MRVMEEGVHVDLPRQPIHMKSCMTRVNGVDLDRGTANELVTLQLKDASQDSKEQTVMHCGLTGLNCGTNGCTQQQLRCEYSSEPGSSNQQITYAPAVCYCPQQKIELLRHTGNI